jgi:hypothetical protein
MPRGRPTTELDKDEFQKVVADIELKLTPTNRTQLWNFVAASDWAMTRKPRALSAQVAMLKAEKLGIVITTPKGNRGKVKGCEPPANAGKRRKRSFPLDVIENVKTEYSALGEKSLAKLLDGELRAAIKAMCWNCSGRSKKEVSLCEIRNCPLWPNRPWQKKGEI